MILVIPNGQKGTGLYFQLATSVLHFMQFLQTRVFAILGDGECAEGSVWEAAMAASHHKIDNLTAIIDRNGLQVNGRTTEVMNTGPLEDKFRSFGWEVKTINGHNYNQLYETLTALPFSQGKPSCIVADTVKCKVLTFGVNNYQFHHWHCELNEIDNEISAINSERGKELSKVE